MDKARLSMSTERAAATSTTPLRSGHGVLVVARWLRIPLALGRRNPLTVVSVGLLWAVGLATGSLGTGPAPALAGQVGSAAAALRDGRWWFPLASMLWCSGTGAYLVATALIVGVVAPVERRVGRARGLLLLVLCQLAGVWLVVGVLGLLGDEGAKWVGAASHEVVLGPVGAVLALALAASASISTPWRRRLRVVILVGLAMMCLYSAALADLARLSTALVGLLAGALLWRRRRVRDGFSTPEMRMLVAVIVAASAIGPLIAAFLHTRVGPLSLLRYVFAAPPPDVATVQQLCLDPTMARDCARMQARLRLYGIGPAVMSAIPVLLLLATAEGLRLGRRAAWLAAVGLNLALAALGIVLAVATAQSPRQERLMIGPGHHLHSWVLFVLPLLQPMLVTLGLIALRRLFPVRAPRGTYRGWITRAGATLLAVSAIYVGGSVALADDYQPVPTLGDVLADLPTRFVPAGYLGAFDPSFLPIRPVTTLLYEWTGVIFWAVVLAGALRTFARTPTLATTPPDQVRRLLAAGGGSLAYPVTWAGNSYWFTANRRAGFAYRVIAGVAITTGNPIGDRAEYEHAVRGFVQHCQENGWTLCLYAVNNDVAGFAINLGLRTAHVGEEALLPLRTLNMTGKRWQNVRTARNRAGRAGITAEWCRFEEAPAALTDQIRMISEQWLASKGVPEMRFTLGGLAELADTEVRLLLAVDQDRTVHAVTSWMPVRDNGELVGYTLDFMRRRPEAFNGIMDFLIAAAAHEFQDDGLRFLSLSGAPLARIDRGEPATWPQRLLDLTANALEPIYGFKSLFAFKARFRPNFEPLHLAYPDTAALPRIGHAITRAYLPHLTVRQTARIAITLARTRLVELRATQPKS